MAVHDVEHGDRTAVPTTANGLPEPTLSRLLIRLIIQLGSGTLVFGGLLFLAAGSFDWPMAWVYLGLGFVGISIAWALLARIHPDLVFDWPSGKRQPVCSTAFYSLPA